MSMCAELLKSRINRTGAHWDILTGGRPQHMLLGMTLLSHFQGIMVSHDPLQQAGPAA